MNMPARTKNDLSKDQTNNYWAAYFIVSDALSFCREKLVSQEQSPGDPASQGSSRPALANIEANLASLQALRMRFNAGQSKVLPPDPVLIRSLALGSAKLTGIVGDPARLPEVIEIAAEIVSKFHALEEL